MTEMSEKTMAKILMVLIPFALWMSVPRYIEHFMTYPDTAAPEDLLPLAR